MRKTLLIVSIFITLFMAGTALAGMNYTDMRRQADSEYRIAVKAYKKAVREHGESLTGITASERQHMCRKISSALYDNRWQANQEDILTAPKYRRQTKTLEGYSKAFCTK